MTRFTEMWRQRNEAGAYICIGLDPQLGPIRECFGEGGDIANAVCEYMCDIVDHTHPFAAAYKPQSAFYEQLGERGPEILARVIHNIRSVDPTIPVILDYKRGDIGSTNSGYTKVAFDYLDVDAVTVHPYLGMEAMRPFLNYDDRTVIVLCRTSNPGAGEFQDVPCTPVRLKNGKRLFSTVEEACREGYSAQDEFEDMPPMPLYQFVATRVAQSWNDINGNCAVVVGATYPEELGIVRDLIGHMPILLPGIGAQGGDMEKSFAQGVKDPRDILAANNASGINFAFQKIKDGDRLKYHPNQYMEAAAEAAEAMNNAARELLAA